MQDSSKSTVDSSVGSGLGRTGSHRKKDSADLHDVQVRFSRDDNGTGAAAAGVHNQQQLQNLQQQPTAVIVSAAQDEPEVKISNL